MLIKLEHMSKRFDEKLIFDDVSIEFLNSGLYYISGESGSGKTTLLNIIAGYETIEGKRKVSSNATIAYIFQSYELIDELTVEQNIFLHDDVYDIEKSEYSNLIITKLGLNELFFHYPKELSSGQRQRVGIARALLMKPDIIICDEPIESLDIDNKEEVLKLLKALSKDKVVIIASHEKALLENICDYYYEIVNHQLVCRKKNDNIKECVTTNTKKYLNTKKMRRYLKEMIGKNTWIHSIVLCLLLLFTVIFSQLNQQLFKDNDYISSINSDVFTLNLQDLNDAQLQEYIDSNSITKMYTDISFSVWNYKGKSYHPKVLPYLSDCKQVKILGKRQLTENQIIINQFTAHKMMELLHCNKKDLLNEKIVLDYTLNEWEKYPIEFIIVGIADEKDVNGKMNIYYCYDYLKMLLEEKEYVSGMSHYQYLQETSSDYIVQIDKESLGKSFYEQTIKQNIPIYHNVYSHMETLENRKAMYQILFHMVQCILCSIVVIYTLFYILKDTFKNMKNMAILVAVQIPFKILKRSYYCYKVCALILVGGVSVLEIFIYNQFYKNPHILDQYIFVCTVILMSTCLLWIVLSRFKKNKLFNVLKDSKDN